MASMFVKICSLKKELLHKHLKYSFYHKCLGVLLPKNLNFRLGSLGILRDALSQHPLGWSKPRVLDEKCFRVSCLP